MLAHIGLLSENLIELFLFSSDHSCNYYLQLCLVGASRPLGVAAVEEQQDHELSVILISGDRLCVRIFSINLHSCCGKPWIFNLK